MSYVGYSIGYVEMPGTIIAVVVVFVCAACFVLCPRKPPFPKVVVFLLFIPAAMYAVDCVIGYYFLHILDPALAERVTLK
jgi:hypothetical protein